jgi:hypothetical protein
MSLYVHAHSEQDQVEARQTTALALEHLAHVPRVLAAVTRDLGLAADAGDLPRGWAPWRGAAWLAIR